MLTGLIGTRGAKKLRSVSASPVAAATSRTAAGPQYRPWQRPMPIRVPRLSVPACPGFSS